MRRLSYFLLSCIFALSLSVTAAGGGSVPANAQGRTVYLGGNAAGFLLSMGGVQVIAVGEVRTESGVCSPARDAGLKGGDLITKAAGIKIEDAGTLNQTLDAAAGRAIEVTVRRDGEEIGVTVCPVREKLTGKYKIGVLIRDTLSGIGTVTYLDREKGRFGALGHGVCDENNNLLGVASGKVYECSIVSVTKGVRGKAGELKGIFVGEKGVGTSDKINACGLYGELREDIDYSAYRAIEIASLSEAHMGEAYIWSTVDGIAPAQYSVSVVKVDENNKENKNFVLKITDSELICRPGGIGLGMSGSPIVQDGKLIGAVTHVFLNDPTRGYGIGIENMLDN